MEVTCDVTFVSFRCDSIRFDSFANSIYMKFLFLQTSSLYLLDFDCKNIYLIYFSFYFNLTFDQMYINRKIK